MQANLQSHNVSLISLIANVREYKRAVTYQVHPVHHSQDVHFWQQYYNKHIIQNQLELEGMAGYILGNSQLWADILGIANNPKITLWSLT